MPGRPRACRRLIAPLLTVVAAGCIAADLPLPPTDRGGFSAGFRLLHPAEEGGPPGLEVLAVWYPTDAAEAGYEYPGRGLAGAHAESRVALNAIPATRGAPYPVVVAAHGLFGSAIALAYLAEYLARHGYVVAATDYADTTPPDYTRQMAAQRLGPGEVFASGLAFLTTTGRWARDLGADPVRLLTYLEHRRLRPTRRLLDYLLGLNDRAGSSLEGLLDTDRVGMMGHSLGGYTTLGLVGGHPDAAWRDERLKLAVLLSAGLLPYRGHVGQVAAPVLVMYGENDPPGLGEPQDRYQTYTEVSGPRAVIVVAGAEHLTFSNPRSLNLADCWEHDRRLAVIVAYTLAFLDTYLRAVPEARARFEQPARGVLYQAYQWPGDTEHTWGELPPFVPRRLRDR